MASVFVAILAPTWADPDLWGHLRFGADIVAGGIPARDGYAFTSGRWINQYWLAEVLMHGAFALGGTPLLVTMKLILACAVVGVVLARMLRAGVREPLLELLLLLCVAALYPAIPTIRPQLFSLVAFAVILDLQTRRDPPEPARFWVAPPLFAAWANLHGGWLLGLTELGLWLAVELVVTRRGWRERAAFAAIGIACALATLATPYGITLWARMWDAMNASLRDVGEWRGLFETGAPALVVWVALVGVGAYASIVGGVRPSRLVVLLWLAYSSWRVRRLLPFFGLATVMLLASNFAMLFQRTKSTPPPRPSRPVVAWALVVAACVIGAINGRRVVQAFGCLRMDHTREADVHGARFIAANRLSGRLLVYSDWGVYAIWHFAPALQVSLDGRREFAFSLDEIARHGDIYWNAPSALAAVTALAPDYAWLPATLPVIPTLVRAGWIPVFTSERSVVLSRSPGRFEAVELRPLPPCFPADP
jgi:hypothetical protein